MVQVIPFRRNDAALEGIVRAESAGEAETRTRVLRNTGAEDGWRRKDARAPR